MTRHHLSVFLAGSVILAFSGCVDFKPAGSRKTPPAPTNARPAAVSDTTPPPKTEEALAEFEAQVPDEKLMIPFKDQQPIQFVSRSRNGAEWARLAKFWNEATEKVRDPQTGQEVERKVVRIKVPLGLTQEPSVPAENPMTVARWNLGKQLYFDKVLSADGTVSCATCHSPSKGYTDQLPVSTGINGSKGGVSAPTVMNAAYNPLQFWDGRAVSLEDQAQGPPQNPIEMFDGDGHAWNKVVQRVRQRPEYIEAFKKAYGTEPTRDSIAKAIATYERTVLLGNSLVDRAEVAKLRRLEDEGKPPGSPVEAVDYETVLKDAFTRKDAHALIALNLDPEKDAGKAAEVARQLKSGRELFFGKARCNSCHAGDNFTDNLFHNLGVGVSPRGDILPEHHGRYARLPVGHKNPELLGAWKTPTLRGLVATAPYLHDGSEPTLEKVVEFYDRGGNPSEFLDPKMRDLDAEKFFVQQGAEKFKQQYGAKYPEVKTFNGKPIIPLKLGLTEQEKKDLVLFMRALQGDPIDPVVASDPKLPAAPTASR